MTDQSWTRTRNIVLGITAGALITWAFRSGNFGATWLAAIGGVLAIATVAFVIGKLRKR